MGPGTHFKPVLGDDSVNSASVSRVVFCSGKHYYALAKQREVTNSMDTAIIRLEVSGLFVLVSTLCILVFWGGSTFKCGQLYLVGDQGPVVQRPDNFIRWIRHYLGSGIYFTLNVVQGFRTLQSPAVVRVCMFACTRANIEIFAQIETVR